MDIENDLKYVYKEEFIALNDSYGEPYCELFFSELGYVENGNEIKVHAFPYEEIYTFEELAYFEKNWKQHVANVWKWMKWFQTLAQSVLSIDVEWIKDNEKQRWDSGEIDVEGFDTFEAWWEDYKYSNDYYEQASWDQQRSWDDFKEEFEDEVKIISSGISEWFDSYDNLNARMMDQRLKEAEEFFDEQVSEFYESVYDSEDFDDEELAQHFEDIFK